MADDALIAAFPLDSETPESILTRLLSDMNAGIDPADPLYADTLVGSVWDDLNRAATLEFDRIYDRMMSEVPASALPLTAISQWLDAWAQTIGLSRKDATTAAGVVRFTGDASATIPDQTSVAAPAPVLGADPIVFVTTQAAQIPATGVNYVDVPVVAQAAGSAGNVSSNSVTLLESEVAGVSVSNPDPITSGTDVETDEALQSRISAALSSTPGAGNVGFYEKLALNYPGVGFVTVQPNTPSKGNVTLMIADINNKPSSATVIEGLQAQLDPSSSPGGGYGEAPIGATVIVTTPAVDELTIAATISYQLGYSADGSGGTIALQGPITEAVQAYVNTLAVGATVVRNKVLAAIIDVPGVQNVTALTLNGGTSDVTLASNQVADVNAVTLS